MLRFIMSKFYVRKSYIKEVAKTLYRNFFLINIKSKPILVASIGRSGSTMLYQSLIYSSAKNLGIDNEKLINALKCEAWDLQESISLHNGCVYKTHDLPSDPSYLEKFKIIYLHDKPSKIVTSIFNITNNEGLGWLKLHLKHLRSDERLHTRFLKDEIFNFKDHLVQWKKYDVKNILFIHYEDIWNSIRKIEEFVGFSVEMPPKGKRLSTDAVSENIKIKIEEMYKHLDDLYEKLYL